MPEQASLFGIENLKKGLGFIASTTKAVFNMDLNNDGKIDNAEKLTFATGLIPQVFTIVPLWPRIKEEGGDLQSEEIDELVEYVQTLDFLPRDKDALEQYVKDFVAWINYNRKFILYSVEFFRGDVEDDTKKTSTAKS